jgi:hypothetical protein
MLVTHAKVGDCFRRRHHGGDARQANEASPGRSEPRRKGNWPNVYARQGQRSLHFGVPRISRVDFQPEHRSKGATEKVRRTAAVKDIDGKVTTERDITNGSYPGKEIVGSGSKEGKDIEFTIRLYWAKTRLVQTLYLAEKGKTNEKNATKFLDSLKIS